MALLAFFGLWETTVLAGAAAVSVPVVIHLLNRRRYRIVTWAAMRFLLMAQKQTSRKMRLEQVMLLLCRMALILCVLLAMASVMPWAENVWTYFWPDAGGTARTRKARIHHVIVVDASLGMNQKSKNATCFDRARDLAIRKINSVPAGDGISILLLKENPEWVGETSQDARKMARELSDLAPTDGNASVQTALTKLSRKLADNQKRYPGQAVYFFTDMQRATWAIPIVASEKETPRDGDKKDGDEEKEGDVVSEIARRAKIVFVDVGQGQDDVSNRAVTDLHIDEPFVTTSRPVRIAATIQNFGIETKNKLRIELHVGQARDGPSDKTLTLKRVGEPEFRDVAANGSIPVEFTYQFPKPGTYAVQVRIEDDALPADNAASLIVTVKESIKVLLVNGNPATRRFDGATAYLHFALDQNFDPRRPELSAHSPIQATEKSPTQFRAMKRDRDHLGQDDQLLSYDAIFFCDVGLTQQPPPDLELQQLKLFLRMGGGVVFSAGPEMWKARDTYNEFLYDNGRGLLPGPFSKVLMEDQFLFNTERGDFKTRPLLAFEGEFDKLSLNSSRIQKYMVLELSGTSDARTIMSYRREERPLNKGDAIVYSPTGHPSLVEYSPPLPRGAEPADARSRDRKAGQNRGQSLPDHYRGKVFVFTSSLNMDWGTWPGSPSFLPMMQELVRTAVSGKLNGNRQKVGEVLEEYIPSELDIDVEFTTLRTTTQAGKAEPGKSRRVRAQAQGDVSVFRWNETDQSGIYVMLNPRDSREVLFAVNCPSTAAGLNESPSDLTRINAGKLKDHYPGWDLQVVLDPLAAKLPEPAMTSNSEEFLEQLSPIGPDMAHGLLLAVLVLLLLEVVLAWSFGRHTKVDGALSPPAVGKAWPITIACVFGLLFAGMAFVMVQAYRSGDFMSFLPNESRVTLEKYLGVPPAPPGEEVYWDLGSRPDLFGMGDDFWPSLGILLVGLCLIVYVYRADGPLVSNGYKILIAGLRVFLLLFVLFVLLPQLQLRFDRQSWPDVVLVIDDSRSMGEPDDFKDEKVRDKVSKLGSFIRAALPAKKATLETELKALQTKLGDRQDAKLKAEIDRKKMHLDTCKSQLKLAGSSTWAPSRLQLVQALLAQADLDWLDYLVNKRRTKVHVYHLDAAGRAIPIVSAQGNKVGELTESDPSQITAAQKAVAELEAERDESRLGTALHQVIDRFRGGSATVIMFTDGVTTLDETIEQVAEYAAKKEVPLYFVGVGDDFEVRDLHLDELRVEDWVRVNDTLNFQAKLKGPGIKNMSVPVVLKVVENGKEVELTRKTVKVDEHGKWTGFTLQHRPKKAGIKQFIVELDSPRKNPNEKQLPGRDRRLVRTINILENSLIKVLLVDGTARYDYRFLKSLLEREIPDENNNRSIEVRVVLLDADKDFDRMDRTALADFPGTTEELSKYDVIIFGDCDPNDKKLGEQRLKNLVEFVSGGTAKDNEGLTKPGGGLLFVAGSNYNPHAYSKPMTSGNICPLAKILPVIPGERPAEEDLRDQKYRLEWSPVGKQHQIFKFTADEAESQGIWRGLAPMYWWSKGYTVAPTAEVLAMHPSQKSERRPDQRHPLIVQQIVGSGRTMFFGFDGSWRWRFREDEIRYNNFWIQTIRYLSRLRISHTDLRLNKQTPYQPGEKPVVTVRFPDNMPLPESAVKVIVEFTPKDKNEPDPDRKTMNLERPGNVGRVYEGTAPWELKRPGKYRFWLDSPDVTKAQGDKPSAEATVEVPPGEMEVLGLNTTELKYAAKKTKGGFYTLANAEELLDKITLNRVSVGTPWPPVKLWSNVFCFALVLGLLTSEWILRKRKHLL